MILKIIIGLISLISIPGNPSIWWYINPKTRYLCLADANNERHRSNHYPFLISYIGTFDKNTTSVKGFKIYVLSEMDLPDVDLTDEQQYLMGICFAMKKIAPVIGYESIEDVQVLAEEQEENKKHFNALFELWQQAIPLLAGRLYTHYTYTFGMRHVMRACQLFLNKSLQVIDTKDSLWRRLQRFCRPVGHQIQIY